MGRPQAFDTASAVAAARDLFWEHGYDATSITDLERATGINRSSLYHAFGSKRGLFDHAVRNYLDVVVGPRSEIVRAPGAGLGEVVDYLEQLAAVLRDDTARWSRLGCLLVNASTSLAARDDDLARVVETYRDDLVAAFTTALAAEIPDAARRARVTAGLTISALSIARTNPAAAAELLHDAVDDLRATPALPAPTSALPAPTPEESP
ncbi:TetR/AcrR family transcriptional regulator [Sanguibacter antarcticus]|uniref:TetR family transcriptional regulator n=1 Tax=Sanguibacter antarcticus TaxID=372484 RepID=A0A2A9E7S6_9MICO|nr:TetR/AcrR family transcriptional regulator [Sanguibacter antarcticus]PFG34611.1 TetR family transcriptional regulator [Sanguibacter antarcticus]